MESDKANALENWMHGRKAALAALGRKPFRYLVANVNEPIASILAHVTGAELGNFAQAGAGEQANERDPLSSVIGTHVPRHMLSAFGKEASE